MTMKNKNLRFAAVDILLLVLAVLPIIGGMVLKVLTATPSDEIEITGAGIYFTLEMPFQDLPITESQVNSWIAIISIFWICLYFTHGIKARPECRRQHIAEWIIEKSESLVCSNMGEYFKNFSPFITAMMALSALSSFLSLTGLYPPTSDLNIVGGWAILVFILITYYKCKCGPLHYIKSFGDPVPLLAPLNIISEVATPISMAFRHYGNILSGTVISILVAAGLGGLSNTLLGWLPGFLGDIPFLRIGIPAVLSVYFDIFSGCLQAFIFAMLTMLYIAGGFPVEDYEARKAKKKAKNQELS